MKKGISTLHLQSLELADYEEENHHESLILDPNGSVRWRWRSRVEVIEKEVENQKGQLEKDSSKDSRTLHYERTSKTRNEKQLEGRQMCSFLHKSSSLSFEQRAHHSRRIGKDLENKGVDRESSKDSLEEERSLTLDLSSLSFPHRWIPKPIRDATCQQNGLFWTSIVLAWSGEEVTGSNGFHLEDWGFIWTLPLALAFQLHQSPPTFHFYSVRSDMLEKAKSKLTSV